MDLFKKLKIKELLYSDIKWKLPKLDRYVMVHSIDNDNNLIIDFDMFHIKPFGLRVKMVNYASDGSPNRVTITKYLYLFSLDILLVMNLQKKRRLLLKERKMRREEENFKEDIKYLPKSLLRDLNIDDVLDGD